MNLPTRPLGTSGLDITTVGFGAWAIGGGGWAFGWGPQDDADSLAAMRRALELGINWSTPPRCTVWAIRKRWSDACCASCQGASDRSCSPSVAWCGTRATAW